MQQSIGQPMKRTKQNFTVKNMVENLVNICLLASEYCRYTGICSIFIISNGNARKLHVFYDAIWHRIKVPSPGEDFVLFTFLISAILLNIFG